MASRSSRSRFITPASSLRARSLPTPPSSPPNTSYTLHQHAPHPKLHPDNPPPPPPTTPYFHNNVANVQPSQGSSNHARGIEGRGGAALVKITPGIAMIRPLTPITTTTTATTTLEGSMAPTLLYCYRYYLILLIILMITVIPGIYFLGERMR